MRFHRSTWQSPRCRSWSVETGITIGRRGRYGRLPSTLGAGMPANFFETIPTHIVPCPPITRPTKATSTGFFLERLDSVCIVQQCVSLMLARTVARRRDLGVRLRWAGVAGRSFGCLLTKAWPGHDERLHRHLDCPVGIWALMSAAGTPGACPSGTAMGI